MWHGIVQYRIELLQTANRLYGSSHKQAGMYVVSFAIVGDINVDFASCKSFDMCYSVLHSYMTESNNCVLQKTQCRNSKPPEL
jgi:hypothetical protein